jgi:hypothetical protein
MCYEVRPAKNRLDYLCPKCGERTLYEYNESAENGLLETSVAKMVRSEIATCRRELEPLRRALGDAVSLDESQFCRKCSPDITTPRLVLRMAVDSQWRELDVTSSHELRAAILALTRVAQPAQTQSL